MQQDVLVISPTNITVNYTVISNAEFSMSEANITIANSTYTGNAV